MFLLLIRKYWWAFVLGVLFVVYGSGFLLPSLAFLGQGGAPAKIAKTPVVVEEIREIGELITAEFYGEVYADLNECYEELLTEYPDSFINHKYALLQQYKGLNKFEKDFTELAKKQAKVHELDSTLTLAQADTTMRANAKQRKLQNIDKNMATANANLISAKAKYDANYKNSNLIYLARGWVKVGFNFTKATENDLQLEKSNDTVWIKIAKPVILNADINPWFIPEKEVKGFEIFKQASRTFTDDEIRLVKARCKKRLIEDATDKGIMTRAAESGKGSLEQFFGLLGFGTTEIQYISE